jgi:hypothetical protein
MGLIIYKKKGNNAEDFLNVLKIAKRTYHGASGYTRIHEDSSNTFVRFENANNLYDFLSNLMLNKDDVVIAGLNFTYEDLVHKVEDGAMPYLQKDVLPYMKEDPVKLGTLFLDDYLDYTRRKFISDRYFLTDVYKDYFKTIFEEKETFDLFLSKNFVKFAEKTKDILSKYTKIIATYDKQIIVYKEEEFQNYNGILISRELNGLKELEKKKADVKMPKEHRTKISNLWKRRAIELLMKDFNVKKVDGGDLFKIEKFDNATNLFELKSLGNTTYTRWVSAYSLVKEWKMIEKEGLPI